MSLTDEERRAIVSFRIQKAEETLGEAIGIATLGYWNAVANRLFSLGEEDVKPMIGMARLYIDELVGLINK